MDPLGTTSTHFLWPVTIANVAICIGYVAVSGALTFGRYSRLFRRRLTRASGAVFFITCGLHHLDNAIHLQTDPLASYSMAMLNGYMVLIDITQAIAVWIFAVSAAIELGQLLDSRRGRHDDGRHAR